MNSTLRNIRTNNINKLLLKSFSSNKSYSVNKEPKILVIGACGQIGVELVP